MLFWTWRKGFNFRFRMFDFDGYSVGNAEMGREEGIIFFALLGIKNEFSKQLLLRGARQVGKSSTVREFGKQFDYFLEINFEKRHLSLAHRS